MPVRRYDRTHRDAQAQRTRALVLDAAIAALARQEDCSIAALAKAAGVSVPTAYRYYPTRQALADATQEAIGARLQRPAWPEAPDDLAERVRQRFEWFEANGVIIRAILSSSLGHEILASVHRRREAANSRSLRSRVSHLDAARARAVIAIVSMLDDAHTWRQLRDTWRLSNEEAAFAATWAMDTLLAGLATSNNGGRDGTVSKGRAGAMDKGRRDPDRAVSRPSVRAPRTSPGGRRRTTRRVRSRRDDRG